MIICKISIKTLTLIDSTMTCQPYVYFMQLGWLSWPMFAALHCSEAVLKQEDQSRPLA